MKANKICTKAGTRLNRIKKISRVLKVLFLLSLLCLVWRGYFLPFVQRMPDGWSMVWGTYATFSDVGESGSSLNTVLWSIPWTTIPVFLSSPWILGGLFIVVISRIMDEGRKIQEEQELTV